MLIEKVIANKYSMVHSLLNMYKVHLEFESFVLNVVHLNAHLNNKLDYKSFKLNNFYPISIYL